MSNSQVGNFVNLSSRMTFIEGFAIPNSERYKDFGNIVSSLLNKNEIVNDPNAVGLLDDLLGAVYCLILAEYHGFENRTNKPIEIPVIQNRALQIQEGQVRIEGKWIAGWHFNSAIYRISSVYHRLLKLITNSSGNIGQLISTATTNYKNWTGLDWIEDNARKVQEEVNKLKHDIEGIYFYRKVTFEQALDSIVDLLKLIESWSSISHTSS